MANYLNNQWFNLTYDKTAPGLAAAITPSAYYKAGTNTFTFESAGETDVKYFKVLVNQSATAAESDFENCPWEVYGTGQMTYTFNQASGSKTALKEGINYIHIILMDDVGNISGVKDSASFIYDITAPTISAVVITGKDGQGTSSTTHTVNKNVTVKVTAADGTGDVSQISKIVISGDITTDGTDITWTAEDVTAGYKDVAVTLTDVSSGKEEEVKNISVVATDKSGNASESKAASIELDITAPKFTCDILDPTDETKSIVGQFVRYDAYSASLATSDEAGEIVKVRIYQSTVTDPAWVAYTSGTYKVSNVALDGGTATDGEKTIVFEAMDDAGKVTTITKTFTRDTVAPTVTFTSVSKTRVSAQTGYSSFNVVGEATDANLAATTNVKLMLMAGSTPAPTGEGEVCIKSWTATPTTEGSLKKISFTQEITEAELKAAKALPEAKYQDYKMYLLVDDAAIQASSSSTLDDWGRSSDESVKTVTVDEVGPNLTAGTINSYYNDGFSVNWTEVAEVGGGQVTGMYVWVSKTSGASEVPSGATKQAWSTTQSVTKAQLDAVGEGTFYFYVCPVDDVDNKGQIASKSSIYDVTAPTGTIAFEGTAPKSTSTRTQTVTISASDAKSGVDATSGVAYMYITGSLVGTITAGGESYEIGARIPFNTSASVTLTRNSSSSAADKTIYLQLEDNVGNKTEVQYTSDTITLETTAPTATIDVYKGTDTTHSTPVATQAKFKDTLFHIQMHGTDGQANVVQWRLVANSGGAQFTAPSGVTIGEWYNFTTPGSTVAQYLDNLNWVDPSEQTAVSRTVLIQVMDDNGNIGDANFTILLDTGIPVVNVTNPDYEKISKKHTLRKNASAEDIPTPESGTGAGKQNYNDYVVFTWKANEPIVEYKVCVNCIGQTAAEAVAISTENGSINMAEGAGGSTVIREANVEVTSLINGTDMSNHSSVGGLDGAYEIIVYVRDESDNWSAIHSDSNNQSPKLTGSAIDKETTTAITDFASVKTSDATALSALQSSFPGAIANDLSGTITGSQGATVTMDLSNYNIVDAGDTVDVYHYE